jgi:hypothetical protein
VNRYILQIYEICGLDCTPFCVQQFQEFLDIFVSFIKAISSAAKASFASIPFFQKHGPHCCEGSIGAEVLYLQCIKYLAQLRRWICGSNIRNQFVRKSDIFSSGCIAAAGLVGSIMSAFSVMDSFFSIPVIAKAEN